jgi:hypothetical protein
MAIPNPKEKINSKRIKVKLRVIFSLQNLIFGSSIFIILLVNKGNYNHI